MTEPPNKAVPEAAMQLLEAAAARKCWSCGCLHQSLGAIERAIPAPRRPTALDNALRAARERLVAVRYECLGCQICYPALAVNALNESLGGGGVVLDACAAEVVSERDGWPPFPGAYTVLHYLAPVAICTLNDEELMRAIATRNSDHIALVGTMRTENLGIERLILNVLANPNIRYLVLCGADSEQTIGHLPGQSLAALGTHGIDERNRIIGARGKRPVLKNVTREAVEHFRSTVAVINRIGAMDPDAILRVAAECGARRPEPATPFRADRAVQPVTGYVPAKMVSDPSGYFVVYVDRRRGLLALEHYRNDGVLDTLIEGHTAAELYIPAIERGLVSRLDHAAHLGRELARAEEALRSGAEYIQDAAPQQSLSREDSACGCAETCAEAS